METARYVTMVEAEPGVHLGFNHAHGTLVRLSENARRFLAGGGRSPLGPLQRRRLAALGFLVKSREAELDVVRQRSFAFHYSGGRLIASVVVSFACNLRCPYCYEQGVESASHASMSLETAAKVAEAITREAHESGARMVGVTLYGGEPLVNFKAARLVLSRVGDWCRAHDVGFETNVITNGTLLNRRVLKALQPNLGRVQLTLEGSPEYHDRTRIGPDGKGTFQRILDAAELALEAGARVSMRIQLSPTGWRGADECLAALDARGLARHPDVQVYFFPILDIEKVCTVKQAACFQQYFSKDMLKELWEIGLKYQANLFHLPAPVWETPYCAYVNKHAWLADPLGRKFKCVSCVGRDDAVTGSLVSHLEQTEAIRGQARELLLVDRFGHDIPQCRDCEYLPSCDGGCAYRAYTGTGDWKQPWCEMHREALREKILYYYRFLRHQGQEGKVELI